MPENAFRNDEKEKATTELGPGQQTTTIHEDKCRSIWTPLTTSSPETPNKKHDTPKATHC